MFRLNATLMVGPEASLTLYSCDERLARIAPIESSTVERLRALYNRVLTTELPRDLGPALRQLQALRIVCPANAPKASSKTPFVGFGVVEDRRLTTPRSSWRRSVRRCGRYTVQVVDGALTPLALQALDAWLQLLPYWQIDVDRNDSVAFRHWICPFERPNEFIKCVAIFRAILRIGSYCVQRQVSDLDQLHAYAVSRGDVQLFHRDFATEQGVTIVCCGNSYWHSDWGGEMVFCDDKGESVSSVETKPGRLIAFTGRLLHRAGVPNSSTSATRRALVMQAAKSTPRRPGD